MPLLNHEQTKRLDESKILWLATVSRYFVPHMVPIWFILHKSKLYICTEESSVKVKHLKNNPNLAFSLENGINPLSGQGKVLKRLPDQNKDSQIIKKFKEKYDWDITTDKQYNTLLEIEITKILMQKKQKE